LDETILGNTFENISILNNNLSAFGSNTIDVIKLTDWGIKPANNTFINLRIEGNIANNTIFDNSGIASKNTLIYNNSFGEIKWSKTDLTTTGDLIFYGDSIENTSCVATTTYAATGDSGPSVNGNWLSDGAGGYYLESDPDFTNSYNINQWIIYQDRFPIGSYRWNNVRDSSSPDGTYNVYSVYSSGTVTWTTNSVSCGPRSTISISQGSVYVNATEISELNTTANITLRNTGYGGEYPSILRKIGKGGVACTDCYNFTSLNNGVIVFNVSNFGNGNITVGKFVRSTSNVSMSKGWNMVSLEMESNVSGDKNISLSVGWNLIGYSSDVDTGLADIMFTNLSGNSSDLNNSSKSGKLQRQISYLTSTSANSNSKKYAFVGKSGGDTALTKGKGYWVKANEAGNLTLPGVGGSALNESYRWSNLVFRNASGVELNITDAWKSPNNWIGGSGLNSIIYYWLVDEDYPDGTWDTVPTSSQFSSWKGYFIYGLKDNITMLRQN
jgi:hypothetical protein